MRRTLLTISQDRLPAGKRRQRRRIGPQDARPQTDGHNKWKFHEGVKLGSRKSSLRPDHDGPGRGNTIGMRAQRLGDRPRRTGFGTQQQAPFSRPFGQ